MAPSTSRWRLVPWRRPAGSLVMARPLSCRLTLVSLATVAFGPSDPLTAFTALPAAAAVSPPTTAAFPPPAAAAAFARRQVGLRGRAALVLSAAMLWWRPALRGGPRARARLWEARRAKEGLAAWIKALERQVLRLAAFKAHQKLVAHWKEALGQPAAELVTGKGAKLRPRCIEVVPLRLHHRRGAILRRRGCSKTRASASRGGH